MDLPTYQLVWDTFYQWAASQLSSNDFLVAGVFGAAVVALRNVPGQIWSMFKHRVSYSVTIMSDNANFIRIASDLQQNIIPWLSRAKVLEANGLSIGFDTSYGWFRGCFVKVVRTKEESQSQHFKQVLDVIFIFTSPKTVDRIFADIISEVDRNKNKTKIYKKVHNYLNFSKIIPDRKKHSIFVKEDIINQIENRVDFFQANEKWYEERGIPYKHGFLLHGPAGTGKTSLAKYIACYSNRDIVTVDLANLDDIAAAVSNHFYEDESNLPLSGVGDEVVSYAPIQKKLMILIEDIDCSNKVKTRVKKKSISITDPADNDIMDTGAQLALILNVLDGLETPHDVIIVATTNHIEKLDPAILRKGRFDDVILIGLLDHNSICGMIYSLLRSDEVSKYIVDNNIIFEDMEGAKVQDALMQSKDDHMQIFELLKHKQG